MKTAKKMFGMTEPKMALPKLKAPKLKSKPATKKAKKPIIKPAKIVMQELIMETMLRRNPITGIFETVPVPDSEPKVETESEPFDEEMLAKVLGNAVQKKRGKIGRAHV